MMRFLAISTLLLVAFAPACGFGADVMALEQEAIAAAVQAASKSVVRIRTVGGSDLVGGQAATAGPTTGVIVSADGLIVSSAYNFAQEPTSILVELPGGVVSPARIIGRDDNQRLVLLRAETTDELPTLEVAPIADVRPGDWAIALGRAVDQRDVAVSVGIVSALNRMYGRAIQTDANVSSINYGGPLIDLQGRALGVLVPMAPAAPGASEPDVTAGTEFYDSGIGFAVPMERVEAVLERWLNERDLRRGLLGIGLKSGNPHATAPIVTNVWPGSPAAIAGLKEGDRILSVDGAKVDTQTALRFQTASRYAGDELKIKVRRGTGEKAREIDAEATLVAELPPYRHPFLGILPARDGKAEVVETAEPSGDEAASEVEPQEGDAGVEVRAVWPDSPADAAGIRSGDRLIKIGDRKVTSVSDGLAALNGASAGEELEVAVQRDDQQLTFDVELASLPTNVLGSSVLSTTDQPDGDASAEKLKTLKLPEMEQTASYLEPPAGGGTPGLVIWLGDGKQDSAEELAAEWRQATVRDRLVLLIPHPGDPAGWTNDDLEYLEKLLQTAASRWRIDPRRVVVAGEGKAGQLAYALALRGRQWIRGVVAVDSPLPRTAEIPPNNPNQRLAILSVETPETSLSTLIQTDLRKFEAAGYPVTRMTRRGESSSPRLDASTRSKIARWIDGLDRL